MQPLGPAPWPVGLIKNCHNYMFTNIQTYSLKNAAETAAGKGSTSVADTTPIYMRNNFRQIVAIAKNLIKSYNKIVASWLN